MAVFIDQVPPPKQERPQPYDYTNQISFLGSGLSISTLFIPNLTTKVGVIGSVMGLLVGTLISARRPQRPSAEAAALMAVCTLAATFTGLATGHLLEQHQEIETTMTAGQIAQLRTTSTRNYQTVSAIHTPQPQPPARKRPAVKSF